MPDNNGNPPFSFTADPSEHLPTNGITTFTDDTVLATLLDSSLSSTPSLVTINASIALSAEIYGIGLETSLLLDSSQDPVVGTYGSAQWWWTYSDPSSAAGLDFNAIGGPFSLPTNLGPYEMIVDTTQASPEPATIAILAGGLAGLGYVRPRKAKKG